MAQIATLTEPITIGALVSEEMLTPLPSELLVTPYDTPVPDSTPAPIGGRFPTPPSAFAFLTDVELENELSIYDGLMAPYVYIGALSPEGKFLEPTIGQIWPR